MILDGANVAFNDRRVAIGASVFHDDANGQEICLTGKEDSLAIGAEKLHGMSMCSVEVHDRCTTILVGEAYLTEMSNTIFGSG